MPPEQSTGDAINHEPREPAILAPSSGGGTPSEGDPAPSPSGDFPGSSSSAGGADESDASASQDSTAPPSESAGGASSEEPGAEPESASGGAVATDADGKPKRKRKRRRKKKRPEGATAEPVAEGSEPPNAESRPPGAGPSRPPRGKRPQKHRPPSERAPFHVGEEVFGKVTSVLDAAIMVDLSGKALAIFDRSEMAEDDLVPSVGDRFVARVHQDGSRGGLVVLTRKPLREEEVKPEVAQAVKDGTLVKGLVTGVIKGGVEVDIRGLRAFAPASGMDLHPHNANFAELLGQVLDFKVVEYDGAGRDLVITRRPMLEQEAHERRKKALELLTEGQVMKGLVRTVVEWGAFVALPEAESLEGLVHVSEASHDPHARLVDLFHPGDEIEVKITKIDERGKIWLSRKALISDPWQDARNEHPPGSRHTGKVTRVEKFGVFVELASGIDGLIHVSISR